MSLKVAKQAPLTEALKHAAMLCKEDDREPNHIHIASLYECLRKQGYELLNYPPSDDPSKVDWDISSKIGDTVHAEIQRQLVFGEIVVPLEGHVLPEDIRRSLERAPSWIPWEHAPALEVKLHEFCDPLLAYDLESQFISGRIDAIIRTPEGKLVILDIKTVKPDEFKREPSPFFAQKLLKWEIQTAVYMHYFQLPSGEHADIGWILMINRGDTFQRRLYQIDYDQRLIDTTFIRAQRAADKIRNKELPVAEPERGPCNLCKFKTMCERERGIMTAAQITLFDDDPFEPFIDMENEIYAR